MKPIIRNSHGWVTFPFYLSESSLYCLLEAVVIAVYFGNNLKGTFFVNSVAGQITNFPKNLRWLFQENKKSKSSYVLRAEYKF